MSPNYTNDQYRMKWTKLVQNTVIWRCNNLQNENDPLNKVPTFSQVIYKTWDLFKD